MLEVYNMKIAYITCQTPFGKGEYFIIDEMLIIKEAKADLSIIPRSPTREIYYNEASSLIENTIWIPMMSLKIFFKFLTSILTNPLVRKKIYFIIKNSRNLSILIKNLLIVPKGIYTAQVIKEKGIEHIHVHWGATTATMTLLISELTGIPWSMTLHRWDIRENNMLKEKLKLSKFVRCISEHGKNELLTKFGNDYKNKIEIIHMGVNIPNISRNNELDERKIIIVTPADLLPVKGHFYLIEACSILVKNGFKNFQCFFYGEGIMKKQLEEQIKRNRLNDYIKMPGMIPHEKLMTIYENEQVDMVVLPSIITDDLQHEGIPVALMEAMSYFIPVISTNTGGIPELLSNGAGIMVESSNSQQLASAIKTMIEDKDKRNSIRLKAYEKVCQEFDVLKNTKKLLKLIKENSSSS